MKLLGFDWDWELTLMFGGAGLLALLGGHLWLMENNSIGVTLVVVAVFLASCGLLIINELREK